MKILKERTYTTSVVHKLICDICGKEHNTQSHTNWGDGYEVNETSIKRKTGDSFPEGGSGEELNIDICPECFDTKLIPWLREQGVTIQWHDWDW